jgi:hypothetical protein
MLSAGKTRLLNEEFASISRERIPPAKPGWRARMFDVLYEDFARILF